jgi:ABC-type nickel/cobalt efflux system permease component RcnA
MLRSGRSAKDMHDGSVYLLVTTAMGTALLHTLIPDHWLPFVLVGRARKWNAGTTALVSGLAALVHTALSITLGLLALGIGLTAGEIVGETLERAGAALLMAFGLAYAAWAWRKGGHFHPGGKLLHARDGEKECPGKEGHGNPEHLHYHADQGMIRDKPGWSAMGLAVIVGMNPCVIVLPVMLASASRGAAVLWLVVSAYVVPSVLLMIGLSVIGVAGGRRIPVPGAARYMEAASGLLIAALGAAFLFFGE